MASILISGAGIAGLSLASQLKKHGIAYTLIEKKPTLSMAGTAIALPANAIRALRLLQGSSAINGLHQVKDIIYSRANARVLAQASLLDAPLNIDKFVALERAKLLMILQQGVQDDMHFNVSITHIEQKETGVNVMLSDPALSGHYKAVIGADGIYSSVRTLGFGQPELIDLGVTTWRWICEYPALTLQPTYMLGSGNAFLAYPIGPNRIYCYAQQKDLTNQFDQPEQAYNQIQRFFSSYRGIASSLLTKLPDSQSIYTGRLRSVPVPLFSQKDLALIGDAGNACSPMLQQGAAMAFEDAIVLAELLAHFPVRTAFEHYRSQRYDRVNWIVKTSDDAIKSFVKRTSLGSQWLRNRYIMRKGPLNVLGWKHLLSQCPLNQLADFLKTI